MRLVSLDSLVVLKDWIVLLKLLKAHPALAEEILAERSVEQCEVLYAGNGFFELAVGLAEEELVDYFFEFAQVAGFGADGMSN